MKRLAKYLGITATALALTVFAGAEDTPRNSAASSDQLVAASAELQHVLDAKTAKQGDTVTAKLSQTIHLNGTALPKNTLLIGRVDSVQASENKSTSKVVLTFDQAKLTNGQQVAVKATLIGVYPTGTLLTYPNLSPAMEIAQQPSGAHGLGLTSNAAASNSGTLSANGTNVRLSTGTELQFAVSPATASASTSTGN
ncbi:MAG TPA: hypothetical protein VKH40_05190 [Alloacidobacterium sp.]|nr:hypothetical protein [Alloacidobacterium sp.]